MTSDVIYIVALGVGFNCPRKIHLNTHWGGGAAYAPQFLADQKAPPATAVRRHYFTPPSDF